MQEDISDILGISVSRREITVVRLRFTEAEVHVDMDETWKLSDGDRARSMLTMFERVQNYIRENGIRYTVIKGSSASKFLKQSHLEAAELRGVAIVAAESSHSKVQCPRQSDISRRSGKRKVGEYVDDDEFWESNLKGKKLRKGSRDIAFITITQREKWQKNNS